MLVARAGRMPERVGLKVVNHQKRRKDQSIFILFDFRWFSDQVVPNEGMEYRFGFVHSVGRTNESNRIDIRWMCWRVYEWHEWRYFIQISSFIEDSDNILDGDKKVTHLVCADHLEPGDDH